MGRWREVPDNGSGLVHGVTVWDAVERPVRRRLTSRDRTMLLEAARARENPLWAEIESCLVKLEPRHTIKVRRMRRELAWLRRQAIGQYDWGKK